MSLADFKGPDWKPSSEGGIGRPKPLRNRRTRAGAGTKAAIHAAKCSHCRICGVLGAIRHIEAHHFIARARQGRWEFDNICGLCSSCHQRITENDPAALRSLALRLTDSEYAYLIGELGEGALERLFGVSTTASATAEATEKKAPDGR